MSETNKTRRPRQTYDDQFKRDAVKLLSQPGYTLAKAAAALGVSQTTLSNWKKTVLPRESADLAAENAQLIRRVRELEMERDFTATVPNQKWTADITYIDTDEGWLYLAVVIDLFSRRVVGWATADHLKAELVCEATQRALRQRIGLARQLPGELPGELPGVRGRGLIHHSDRGSQYASADFQQLLDEHGIRCSMSRQGNCHDNAVSESFFGTLKTELDEPLATRAIAHQKLFDYIEVFYNRKRLHSTLNYMSPAAYEQMHQAA